MREGGLAKICHQALKGLRAKVLPARRGSLVARALRPAGAGALLAALLGPPALGWLVLHDNSRTLARLESLERAHERKLRARPWRFETAMKTDDPRLTLALFLQARRDHDASPFLPIYTRATRRMLRRRRIGEKMMDAQARAYAACGAPEIVRLDATTILARYGGSNARACPPLGLRLEDGRWRLDLADAERLAEAAEAVAPRLRRTLADEPARGAVARGAVARGDGAERTFAEKRGMRQTLAELFSPAALRSAPADAAGM